MSSRLSLVLFLVLCVGGGLVIGFVTRPGEWYEMLQKPLFQPPSWLFAPVWTTLYILIGIAGWRVWRAGLPRAQALWWGQLALNFAWSPLFFAAHLIAPALAVIITLLLVILAFIARTWPRDRLSAVLFLPYAAWVGFASALNGAIWALN